MMSIQRGERDEENNEVVSGDCIDDDDDDDDSDCDGADELVTLGKMMMTSSDLMPRSDPLSQTNDTQTQRCTHTHIHRHTLWFLVTVLIVRAICAG